MKKRSIVIFQVAIFIFFLIYFTQVSPLLPFNGDDFFFNGSMRVPFPLWGVWNPTRVFPEVFSPICGYLAAFCVYPFTHDYVGAVGLIRAIVVSGFITTFFYLFCRLLKKKFAFSTNVAIAVEIFFLLSFFLFFKHLNQPSYTGFWDADFDSTLFYLVPGLMNASVMLWMARYKDLHAQLDSMTILQQGLFLLVLYFVLFSNTQFTIILATYAFFRMVTETIGNFKAGNSVVTILQKIWIYISILLVWLLTIIFDVHGGRSNSLTQNQPFLKLFKATLVQFKAFVSQQNLIFILLGSMLIIVTVGGCIIKRDRQSVLFSSTILMGVLCLIFTTLYLLLAYTKAGSYYVGRADAVWPITFFFLYCVSVSAAYVLDRSRLIKRLTPLLLVLLSLLAFNFNYQPIPSTTGAYDAKTVKAVDNYIIKQIVNADQAGKSKVIVKVPVNDKNHSPKVGTSNWPHSYDMAGELQNNLYAHHIIRTRMKIVFKPDYSVNKKFYENRKDEQPFINLEK
ncbi:hypothetical protein [Limosilactobacillus oris]|uniref:hypothetical protein n=1 Tax=Limosilactobacillus oris TaxID=1632 RepID=UPI0024BA2D56|nr:hypothetical protein [Limosilactobacillus oris]